MTTPSPLMIARALDEIARAAAYLHTRFGGCGLSEAEIGTLSANISLRTLEAILAIHRQELKDGPRPWDEEVSEAGASAQISKEAAGSL